MKRQFISAATVIIGVFLSSGIVQAKTFRASEMSSDQWSQLMANGPQDVVVEFREADEIPVSFASEGDLLETIQTGVSYVKIKKSFWLRLRENDIQMSLDGSNFKPLKDLISGSFTAGAGAPQPGTPVNAINLVLKAVLK